MQIIKKRLKNALNNKILQNQLSPHNIFYVILNPTQTITNTFRKKTLTKLLFKKNFESLKKSSFIYPVCYISSNNALGVFSTYGILKRHSDFKKILVCSLKFGFMIFKNINLASCYYLDNNLLIFYKFYFLLNTLFLSFNIVKNIKMLNKQCA